MKTNTFKTRSFLSIGTFLFFIMLASSGIALKITDHQSYTFFKILSTSVHNISAIGFLIFATGHITKNWKAIKSYMSGTARKIVSREMLAGLILIVIIVTMCCIKAVNTASEYGIRIGF